MARNGGVVMPHFQVPMATYVYELGSQFSFCSSWFKGSFAISNSCCSCSMVISWILSNMIPRMTPISSCWRRSFCLISASLIFRADTVSAVWTTVFVPLWTRNDCCSVVTAGSPMLIPLIQFWVLLSYFLLLRVWVLEGRVVHLWTYTLHACEGYNLCWMSLQQVFPAPVSTPWWLDLCSVLLARTWCLVLTSWLSDQVTK